MKHVIIFLILVLMTECTFQERNDVAWVPTLELAGKYEGFL